MASPQSRPKTAWERAAEKASGRKTTAQMVKSAVKKLQLAGTANPVTRQPRQSKAQQQKLIDGAIGELPVKELAGPHGEKRHRQLVLIADSRD